MPMQLQTQDVAVPGLPGRVQPVALVTLAPASGSRQPATFDPAALRAFRRLVADLSERARLGEIAAVAITGTGRVFCAGADLEAVRSPVSAPDAAALAQGGHDALDPLLALDVPVVALVNGAAIGGGLELALHATYRVASRGAARFALPEAGLGLVPGWGGTYLLPRVVGPRDAVRIMLTDPLAGRRPLDADEAHRIGLVDVLVADGPQVGAGAEGPADGPAPDDTFLRQALVRVGDLIHDRPASGRVRRVVPSSEEAWSQAVEGAREAVAVQVHGSRPAPGVVVDLLAASRTATPTSQTTAEVAALTTLLRSTEFEASRHAFRLTRRQSARPQGAGADGVRRVGVAGAGLMAGQLAMTLARTLHVPVVMRDLDEERTSAGLEAVARRLAGEVSRGTLQEDEAAATRALVGATTDLADLAGCDLVIEAVTELPQVKRAVFAELEAVVDERCVLATNTSALSVSDMARGLAHPERVLGLHFFNPVARMPLVEIVRAEQTGDEALALGHEVVAALGKTGIVTGDRPGFVVNRLLVLLLARVLAAVEGGTDVAVADAALDPLGLPMRPFALLQLVGPAVALHVLDTLRAELGERFADSPGLRALTEAGRPLVLAPATPGAPAQVDPGIAPVFAARTGAARTAAPDAAALLDDVLVHLTAEAGMLLEEDVVPGPDDIDLAMILGAGWPFHLGGITPYLDSHGYSERVLGRRLR